MRVDSPQCGSRKVADRWLYGHKRQENGRAGINRLCPACTKQRSGYYEGIIQLRNRQNCAFERVADWILRQAAARQDVFISKIVETKQGIDFYFSSKKFLHALAKRVHGMYGGTFELSKSLFSRDRQSSREVYRVTALIRLPEYAPGDIVRIDEKLIQVSSIKGCKVIGTELSSGRKTVCAEPALAARTDSFVRTTVSRTRPSLEVIHPTTYQSVAVENPAPVAAKEVLVVLVAGRLYLVPLPP